MAGKASTSWTSSWWQNSAGDAKAWIEPFDLVLSPVSLFISRYVMEHISKTTDYVTYNPRCFFFHLFFDAWRPWMQNVTNVFAVCEISLLICRSLYMQRQLTLYFMYILIIYSVKVPRNLTIKFSPPKDNIALY